MNKNTCTDVMVDALHRDGGIGYSATLGVLHDALDPTMHLHAISTCDSAPTDLKVDLTIYHLVWCYFVVLLKMFNQMRSSQAHMNWVKYNNGLSETL